jgi:hypothetical protein
VKGRNGLQLGFWYVWYERAHPPCKDATSGSVMDVRTWKGGVEGVWVSPGLGDGCDAAPATGRRGSG